MNIVVGVTSQSVFIQLLIIMYTGYRSSKSCMQFREFFDVLVTIATFVIVSKFPFHCHSFCASNSTNRDFVNSMNVSVFIVAGYGNFILHEVSTVF